MIMIIAMIYIFLSYVISDQQLKITFRKSSAIKIHSPLKIQKLQVPTFTNTENFLGPPPPAEKGEDTVFTFHH